MTPLSPEQQKALDLALALGQVIATAEGVPPWVSVGVAGMLRATITMVTAQNDPAREDAAMVAAEAVKAALDARKFGP